MSTGLQKDIDKVIRAALQQGFTPKAIKSGIMLKSPDGQQQVTIHGTPSSQNALNRIINHLKRAGLQWPPPKGRKQ